VLCLFDIDGTLLLKASAAHAQAVLEAMGAVYGLTERPEGSLEAAGRTDLEIARRLALLGGISAERFDAGRDDFRVAASEAYARLCPPDLSAHVAPGIVEVLEELDAREGVRLAVLTGNLEPIAHLKLARAGLGRFFDHGQGGFGSDHEDRTELPAIARARAGGYPARADGGHRRHAARHRLRPRRRGALHRGGHRSVLGRRSSTAPTSSSRARTTSSACSEPTG
jgi:phosphoglycolate phosphatase-like HAD superfamily hydrolase